MAKFLTGNELNLEIEKIFEEATVQINLISPYIKLHDRYISVLKTKLTYDWLKITIVFGKNEEDLTRSMKLEDFNFFKEFPNIEIRHEKRLHAKYYSNEVKAVLTSMNLYSYSQDNNIEAGVLTKSSVFGVSDIASKLVIGEETVDTQAWNYFHRVIEQAEVLFLKVPSYNKGILGSGVAKKYIGSEVEIDKLSSFFSSKNKEENKRQDGAFLSSKSEAEILNAVKSNGKLGFCIRTGVEIPFSLERPFSESAYQNWLKYKNMDYQEKYCHFSGEPSNGETSHRRPILKKNWLKAKEIIS
jgi:hypothetical protein